MSEESAPGGGNILNPEGSLAMEPSGSAADRPDDEEPPTTPNETTGINMGTRTWPQLFPMTWDEQNYTNNPKRVRSDFLGECRRALVRVTSLKNGDVTLTEPSTPEKSRKLRALREKVAKLRAQRDNCFEKSGKVPDTLARRLATVEEELLSAMAEALTEFEKASAKFEKESAQLSRMCDKATELLEAHGARYEELLESLTRIHKGQPKVSWGPVTPETKAKLEFAHAAAEELESLRLEFEKVSQV